MKLIKDNQMYIVIEHASCLFEILASYFNNINTEEM